MDEQHGRDQVLSQPNFESMKTRVAERLSETNNAGLADTDARPQFGDREVDRLARRVENELRRFLG